MAAIIISGPIQICEPSGKELTDLTKLSASTASKKGANLANIDGELAHLGLARGDLKLKYDAKGKRVLVESTFEAPKKLSPKQLKALVEYTRGQWSDGAGEGAFDKLMDKHGVGMDLTPFGSERKTRVQQTDQGARSSSPRPRSLSLPRRGTWPRSRSCSAAGPTSTPGANNAKRPSTRRSCTTTSSSRPCSSRAGRT
jgi:hypothetical protein